MADDPNQALANAAAQIAQLQAQLAAANAASATAMTQANAALATVASTKTALDQTTNDLASERANHAALQAKWDEAFAPAEPGINRGPPKFITTIDNKSFDSLRAARIHALAATLGVSEGAAETMVKNNTITIPLVTKIAGATP
jgi:hypothetical protein